MNPKGQRARIRTSTDSFPLLGHHDERQSRQRSRALPPFTQTTDRPEETRQLIPAVELGPGNDLLTPAEGVPPSAATAHPVYPRTPLPALQGSQGITGWALDAIATTSATDAGSAGFPGHPVGSIGMEHPLATHAWQFEYPAAPAWQMSHPAPAQPAHQGNPGPISGHSMVMPAGYAPSMALPSHFSAAFGSSQGSFSPAERLPAPASQVQQPGHLRAMKPPVQGNDGVARHRGIGMPANPAPEHIPGNPCISRSLAEPWQVSTPTLPLQHMLATSGTTEPSSASTGSLREGCRSGPGWQDAWGPAWVPATVAQGTQCTLRFCSP